MDPRTLKAHKLIAEYRVVQSFLDISSLKAYREAMAAIFAKTLMVSHRDSRIEIVEAGST